MTGQRVTPPDIVNNGGGAYHNCEYGGSEYAITTIARKYGLYVQDLGYHIGIERASELLRQGVMFHIAGHGLNPFSKGGHFIGIRGITEDGKWLIFDSSHKVEHPENNTKEWEPIEIYQYADRPWYVVSKEPL